MRSFYFNKANTRYLLKGEGAFPNLTKRTLDWCIDNEHKIFGCIINRFLKPRVVYILTKDNNKYRLCCFKGNRCFFYLIEDIDNFLKLISLEPLEMLDDEAEVESAAQELIYNIQRSPYTGIARTEGDRIFLYDCEVS